MKIAFEQQAFNLQTYGGVSKYYSRLAKELLELEQQVSIFAGAHVNAYLSSFPTGVVRGCNIKQYLPKTSGLMQAINHYWAQNKIAQWKPDIIHETYYPITGFSKGCVPRVVTVHDMIHELYGSEFRKSDLTTKNKVRSLNRADHIICISENTKKDLMNLFGITSEKITVIHHGVDKQKNYVSYDLIKGDRPYLLYVGVRSGYKNFKLFLKGVSQSSKLLLEFDVISFGGGAFNTAELDYIKSLGFRHDQVGQLSGGDEVLNSLYKGAAAFVYPSLYEGFGLPLLEAMVCMCPIICSNSSSMPEVVGDAAEYFNPMITEDISVAIERVVFSESRSLELVEKGLGRVKKYSWKKCAQETLAVYKNLLGDSSAF